MMIRLIPKIFFNHMDEGLDLFVNGLGFAVLHQDGSLAVVARDGAKAYVVESQEYAAKDRPEIAIETDNIDDIFNEISSKRPDLLHPNLSRVTQRPWGCARVCAPGQDRRLCRLQAIAAEGIRNPT